MTIDLAIVSVCTTLMSLLGLIIYLRNFRNGINQLFGFLSLSISSWTVFNYLTNGTSTNLLALRLVFLFGVATAYSLIEFMLNFPSKGVKRAKLFSRIFTGATALMSGIVFLPEFIKGVTANSINTGLLYPVFILYAVVAVALLIYLAVKQIRLAGTITAKQQAETIATGVLLYAVLALVSNVIIPLFVNDWSSSRFGPVFSLLLVITVGYSVVRHRLFDIKLIIARTFGYILALSVIAGVYTLIIVGLVSRYLDSSAGEGEKQVVYVVVAVVLSLTYTPIKRYFDKLSNKFFYRDSYDPQSLLDKLNNVLVSTLELRLLLKNSGDVISSYIKNDYTITVVRAQGEKEYRAIGSKEVTIDENEMQNLLQTLGSTGQKVVVSDELSEGEPLRKMLSKNNVALVGRLNNSNDAKSESLGYLLLGRKQSGSAYTSLDVKMVELICDEMVIAIQNALRFEEIQNFAVTLQEKVNQATAELKKSNAKLLALDEAKDEFISMASHQLRTPLTSVKGYVSMVLEGDTGKISEAQRKMLNQAFVSSQRMVYLIADLLNVSRLKTGKFVIEAKPTNLADVIEQEISQLIETAKGRDLELTFDKPKDFPLLLLDETKIRQVIMNFADNAIYYTPSGGHIKVGLADKGQMIEFTVTDDGLGVPKAEQPHLFTKFYRAGNAKKARPDGTGLGLFMAKKVIVAQGGALIFKSEEGKGSTFGFSFEKAKLTPTPEQLKAAEGGVDMIALPDTPIEPAKAAEAERPESAKEPVTAEKS